MKSLMKTNKDYKKELFIHLDGLVLIPTLKGLYETKLFDEIIRLKYFTINNLKENFTLNDGYLNIALRLLRSKKLIEYKFDIDEKSSIYKINKNLLTVYKLKDEILESSKFLSIYNNFEDTYNNKFGKFQDLLEENFQFLKKIKKKSSSKFYKYFEGVILSPLLTNLSYYNFLEINNNHLSIIKFDNQTKNVIERIFTFCGFIEIKNNKCNILDKGDFFLNKCSSYGVTVSYLPMFNKINDLLVGNCDFIWDRDKNNYEIHVNRSMNVWGSGGSHKTYFKKINNIIEEIFNQDINKQPRGIIDIGCGDGTFLKHAYKIIINNTKRKDYLKTHPLIMIGTDINKAARIASRKKLNNAKIDSIIINGNIGDPDSINNSIKDNYGYELSDFLNTRTFLDHNRIYKKPNRILYKNIYTSGSFAYKGNIIEKNELINNLIEHFLNWAPYIKKNGLILLELHTINPNKVKSGHTLSCAYDTTHGFSDQYLIEHDTFSECLNKANLSISKDYLKLYPDNSNPTVSINYIK